MIKGSYFFRSESNFMHALYIFFLTIRGLPVNEEGTIQNRGLCEWLIKSGTDCHHTEMIECFLSSLSVASYIHSGPYYCKYKGISSSILGTSGLQRTSEI